MAAVGPATAGGATVRHYCQGIGDAHLLKFTKSDGSPFWMLIDCGIHSSISGGTQTMAKVVEDIAAVTNRRLDVIVLTHEHTDHLSAFQTAADRFREFTVGEVWMAWTENPADPQARELDKFKDQALSALQEATARLDRASALSPYLSAVGEGLRPLLGFNFSATGERVRAARDAAIALAPGASRYFEPKDPPIGIPGLANLRIYVLGPPRDAQLLGITDRAGETYALTGSGGWPLARALNHAFQLGGGSSPAADDSAPFDANVGWPLSGLRTQPPKDAPRELLDAFAFFSNHYAGPVHADAPPRTRSSRTKRGSGDSDQSWRRIDQDWLGISADLAMQLDSRTNNTSLALAFEFVDSRRVLLFGADAQVGNWLSWQDLKWTVDGKEVTGPDLLSRSVYYKVGHHGSENATLREKGLALMTSPDLSAFIPTNEADAKKVRWGAMPFSGIVAALHERCGDRVIRADDAWVATDQVPPGLSTPSGAIHGIRHEPGLWVEIDLA